MKSASFRLFCSPDELLILLKMLNQRFNLNGLIFTFEGSGHGKSVNLATPTKLPNDIFRLFLHPSSESNVDGISIEDLLPYEWGWLDIRPGVVTHFENQKILTLTQFEAGESSENSFSPVRALNWLKRRFKPEVNFGMLGTNYITGESSAAKNLGYTKGALDLINAGFLLKGERTHRSFFVPLEQ